MNKQHIINYLNTHIQLLSTNTYNELLRIIDFVPDTMFDANVSIVNGHAMLCWDEDEHHLEVETIHVMSDWFYRNRITGEHELLTCNYGENPSIEFQELFKNFMT